MINEGNPGIKHMLKDMLLCATGYATVFNRICYCVLQDMLLCATGYATVFSRLCYPVQNTTLFSSFCYHFH